MSEAKLSDKLYRWIGENGGWQIGRKVLGAGPPYGPEVALMRCEFGRLYWVYATKLIEHDTSYREQEKEAEGAGSTRAD